ncbi:hypothetical protein MNEG_15891 [Monoraphidium neglectum]|uniref:Uncharacterized protein n=1 Tax=Monoraphidium neglectum TaxID=145388 RepID=A0A0D2IVX6_9CHLO|nr:hypothetical protein MNEG_15891 [Monoraphidium neglectum]KIY92072.1 hypothetical protein MNEG_15891 [Monoraphidium neglectum]|eukprot:XP_013891092.1 hypothetical protein MNEG_15891 [Monoraphidium neglectum]
MTLANRGGCWQALVQFREAAAAAVAKQYLDGYAMYPGGANKIQLEFSMQRDLHVAEDDEYGWDWTRAEVATAAAARQAAATAAAAAREAAAAAEVAAAAAAAGGAVAAAAAREAAAAGSEEAVVAAVLGQQTPRGSSEQGHVEPITGADYVRAHEEVVRIAVEAAGSDAGGIGAGTASTAAAICGSRSPS